MHLFVWTCRSTTKLQEEEQKKNTPSKTSISKNISKKSITLTKSQPYKTFTKQHYHSMPQVRLHISMLSLNISYLVSRVVSWRGGWFFEIYVHVMVTLVMVMPAIVFILENLRDTQRSESKNTLVRLLNCMINSYYHVTEPHVSPFSLNCRYPPTRWMHPSWHKQALTPRSPPNLRRWRVV